MNHSVKVTACIGWMCWGLTGAASAATNYWDTNGAAEGFGTAGGTWGVEPFWSSDATGLSAPAVTHTTASDDLVFGTRQHGLAAGTLAVDGSAQAFRSLRFGAASGPVTITGTNSYAGGTTVRRGTLEALASAHALPAAGGITVESGAELVLKAGELTYNNAGGVGNGNPITVLAGGALTLASPFNAGYGRLITLKGGTLNGRVTQNNDNANYINNLTLHDGARVTGHKIRVGAHSPALITVGGSAPSSLEAGINMVNSQNRPLTLDVADVTGDDAVDLSIPAEIRDYSALYTNMPIIKAGAGTASLSGTNTHVGPVTVAAGTLALDAAGALNAGNALILAGGALAMGSHSNAEGKAVWRIRRAIRPPRLCARLPC